MSTSSSSSRAGIVAYAEGRDRSGPSGLHIGGASPTSPSGWDAMRRALQDAKVRMQLLL